MNRPTWINAAVFAGLVALGALSRFTDIAPNFAAVGAVALFAGFFFSSRIVAVCVPVCAMLISDAFLGWHDGRQMAVVYACLTMPVLFRAWLGARPPMMRAVWASLACSIVFFLFTNLAVWGFGTMYTHDSAGLTRCFALALSFLRFTLAGDVLFTLAIFGAFRLATRPATPRPTAAIALGA